MKESEVAADYECPKYEATINELKNFKTLVKKLEVEYPNASVVKITVSRRYKENYLDKIDENSIDKIFLLDHVSNKKPEKVPENIKGYAYEVVTENERKMQYKTFQKNITPSPKLSVEEKEDLTLEMLFKEEKLRPYVVDQVHSLFPKRSNVMNLNEFTYAESLLHAKIVEDIRGIQKSNIYIGQFYTVFSFHLEFFDLGAVNFLHWGDEKIWYIVPHTDQEKLENLMNYFGTTLDSSCDKISKHRTLMIPPSILKKNGIKFTRVIQKPFEFIIIFPGGHHSGFNCGVNIAEAINYCTDSWLERYPKYSLCDCEDFNEDTLNIKHIFDNLYNRETELRKNNNSFTCDICSKTFKEKKYIARHMKNHNQLIERFFCSYCSKSYSRKERAELHIKDHKNKNFAIRIEPKMVKNVINPNKGKVKHHKKVCLYCDKIFARKYCVEQHFSVCKALKH